MTITALKEVSKIMSTKTTAKEKKDGQTAWEEAVKKWAEDDKNIKLKKGKK